MFKNRSIQMKFVKDVDANPENVEVKIADPAEIAQIVADATIKTVAAIGGVVAANQVLKTVCILTRVIVIAKIKK